MQVGRPCDWGELNNIKYQYSCLSAAMYVDKMFVKGVHEIVEEVLVEIHFELHHLYIHRTNRDESSLSL
jgi:mRNA-degrading endonuclease HigB of HigAB toxin-antitoxin module